LKRRFDRPGRDRQRSDALRRGFTRHAVCHRHHCALRRRVVNRRPRAAAAARHARHVDNDAAPIGEHVWQQGLHAVKRSLDVEREGFLHQRIVDLKKFCSPDGGARGIEQELDVAESCNCPFGHRFNLDPLSDVDLDGRCLAALSTNLRRRFGDAFLVDVGANDIGALARTDQRGGAADAARRAGDNDGLSSKSWVSLA
jgi:hypothetical protein